MGIEKAPIEGKSEKEMGKNVTIHAIFMRHGEKEMSSQSNPETSLTPEGREQSEQFGENLEERDAIKGFASDTDRTRETSGRAVASSPTENKMRHAIKKELAFKYNPEGVLVNELQQLKTQILKEDFNEQAQDEKERRLQDYDTQITDRYLSFGSTKPDADTYSPEEAAAQMAKRANRYLNMTAKLKSGSDIDLINVTHDFMVAAFLKEVIVRDEESSHKTGFDSINDIGGPIQPTDSFEIRISTDDQGEPTTSLLFRDQEYGIDQDRLSELVAIANKKI